MSDRKDDPTDVGDDDEPTGERSTTDDLAVDRRNYMRLAAGTAALGGLGLGTSLVRGQDAGGPANPDDWQLAFEDTFDAGALDTSKWEIGYGWGTTDRNSAGRIDSDEVAVRDGRLHLSFSHSGDPDSVRTSAVNTKETFGAFEGSYWEASIQLPGRTGVLPAFWTKPNSEDWPPEIDVIEIFQNDGGWEDTHRAEYHVHYSTSTVSDDSSTHDSIDVEYDSSDDLTEGFHVYAAEWLSDRVTFYFDGIEVGSITEWEALEALRNGGPHYMMLTNMIDKVGTPDYSESWDEEMVVDWVRVWEYAPGSGGSDDSDDSDDTTDTTPPSDPTNLGVTGTRSDAVSLSWDAATDDTGVDHYNVHVDGSLDQSVSGTSVTVSGLAADTTYDFAVTAVDAAGNESGESNTVSATTEPSADDTTRHYFWVRSDDGDPVTYAFETSGGNISVDDGELSDGESDEWVADDGFTAGGTEHASGGDGFWFYGDITDLSYDGAIDTFVDDEYVDPDSLVDESKPGPEKPSDDDSTDDGSTDDSTDDGSTDDSTDDGSTDDGSTDTSTAPVVDSFSASERGSPNPHADIVVDWAVSDADGDLGTVLVQVRDASGTVVDAARTTVNGESSADVNYFRIKHARGETFDVSLTVTDGDGTTATASGSVTE